MIVFKKVKSSQIKAVAYNETSLFVIFNNDSMYEYFDAPKEIYEEMIEEGASVGKIFNAKVRNILKYQRTSLEHTFDA